MSHLVNIGDTRTLISHPACTTHRQLDDAQQLAAGVLPDMVRMSVGLEHIDDILWDIDQALAAAHATGLQSMRRREHLRPAPGPERAPTSWRCRR